MCVCAPKFQDWIHNTYSFMYTLTKLQNWVLYAYTLTSRLHHQRNGLTKLWRSSYSYLRVTSFDSKCNGVIMRPLVQQLHAVPLCCDGRGKVDCDHLKESVARREPFPHHRLQQGFPFFFLCVWFRTLKHSCAHVDTGLYVHIF